MVLSIWDYIFAGIQNQHRVDRDFGDMYYIDGYAESKDDPLINLDFLCIGMIENIRSKIYKQDYEDCLEVFFNYPELKGASRLISIATKIENAIFSGEKVDSDLFKSLSPGVQKEANDSEEKLHQTHSNEEEKNTILVEESKQEKPKFFDPLSNPGFMTKPKTNHVERVVRKEESEHTFPSKRISARKQSNDSAEGLDDSPKNIFNSKPKYKPVEDDDFINDLPYGYRGQKSYQDFDTEEDGGRHNRNRDRGHYMESSSSTVNNFMNYLSTGVNIIKEKK